MGTAIYHCRYIGNTEKAFAGHDRSQLVKSASLILELAYCGRSVSDLENERRFGGLLDPEHSRVAVRCEHRCGCVRRELLIDEAAHALASASISQSAFAVAKLRTLMFGNRPVTHLVTGVTSNCLMLPKRSAMQDVLVGDTVPV